MPEEVTNTETPIQVAPEDRAVLLEAWLDQATEWTKSIFTMSSAAIGLIITGVFAAPSPLKPVTLIFLAVSIICFAVATISCVSAFTAGTSAIRGLLKNDGPLHAAAERDLARLKPVQYDFFCFGLLLLLVAAFIHVTAIDS